MTAALIASMMGAAPGGAGLASLIDIPCGVCLVSGTDKPNQGRTVVAGTIVCDGYHAAIAASAMPGSLAHLAGRPKPELWMGSPSVHEAAERIAAIDHKGTLGTADRLNIAAAVLGVPEGSD